MLISSYLSKITLNLNELNYPTKAWSGWLEINKQKKQRNNTKSSSMLPTKDSCQLEGHRFKGKEWKRILHASGNTEQGYYSDFWLA